MSDLKFELYCEKRSFSMIFYVKMDLIYVFLRMFWIAANPLFTLSYAPYTCVTGIKVPQNK